MEGFSPAARSAGSSTIRLGGDAIGRIASVVKTPHCSKRSESGMGVGAGTGTRFEQPGPEQGVGCLGPGSPAGSSESEEGEPLVMSPSSWLILRSRSEFEETRWLQPAQAERGHRDVDQEQHRRSGCPPPQSLVTHGPHHCLTAERKMSRSRKPS